MESTFKLLTSDGKRFNFKMKWITKSEMLMNLSKKKVVPLENIDAQTLAPILEWLQLQDMFDKQTPEIIGKIREASRILQISDLRLYIEMYQNLKPSGVVLEWILKTHPYPLPTPAEIKVLFPNI